eukprot:TRINITY_DN4348_c0_g1_i1.p1 TRINITY_DN4348_c0_g1~~TRINITY_DN4348_c0_g1_i1.p1  ORF type:complete len:139 (-),score=20.66 TRINITY_DN4348_c0_g1_i1:83-499(-)
MYYNINLNSLLALTSIYVLFFSLMAEQRGTSSTQPTAPQVKPDIASFRNAFDTLLTQVFIVINNCNKETKESESGNQNELISSFSRQMNKCHDMVEQMEGLDTTPRELEQSIAQVKQQIDQRVEVIKQCKEEGLFRPS